MNNEPLAYRPADAARMLGIAPRTLWQLTHDGKIPAARIGEGKRRAVLYSRESLEKWLADRMQQGTR